MFQKVSDLEKFVGTEIALRGWIYRQRASNKVAFVVLRDSSGIVQCVAKSDMGFFKAASETLIESSIELKGMVKKDERAPGGYEITLTDFKVISPAERFPITKDQSTEFLRDVKHLWLRSRKMSAILKIRSTVFGAIHEFFRSKDYYEFQSPIFTSNAAEGGSTLFKVDYYDKKVFLAQTWQLYAEAAIFALEKIYTISPSFRAEKSRTSRHVTEYWHAEMEAAWMGFDELQEVGEQLISFICEKVLEKNIIELEILEVDIEKLKVVKPPFPRLTYDEALALLEKEGMKVPYGKDLRTIEEEKITAKYDKPVIVTRYPKAVKAFYMREDPEDPEKVLAFDMLVPTAGEIIGASERETNLEELEKKLRAEGEEPESYGWYFDTRRYGSVQHAGFGMGVERVIQWICGLESIQEAISFPRTPDRVTP